MLLIPLFADALPSSGWKESGSRQACRCGNKSQSPLSALSFYAFDDGHIRKVQWNRTNSVRETASRSSLGF